MLSLFVPCPSRLGFNSYFQDLQKQHISEEFTTHKPTLFSDGLPDSLVFATLLSILPCVIAKCVFSIAWTHLSIAWTPLAIVAGTLFALAFLTTPIPSCFSPTLYKITNFMNMLTFLAIIAAHVFYTYMTPSPLSIASLALMIATPFADSYADALSAKSYDQLLQSNRQEARCFTCMMWGTQKDDPTKNTSADTCKNLLVRVLKAKYLLRLCLTTAWGCLYALAPAAATPLQQAFTSVLLIRHIATLPDSALCIRNIFRTINSPAEGL